MIKNLFLGLAIVGAIVPYLFFLNFFSHHGLAPAGFISALFVNGASGGITADLVLSSIVFWIVMFRRKSGPGPWLFVLLNLLIGLSCALPAYLYAIERSKPEGR